MRTISVLAVTLAVGLLPAARAGTHPSCCEPAPPSCAAPLGCAAPVAVCHACESAVGACGCMACGSGVCGFSASCMPACSVCNDGMGGWDCCWTEAIDVDSLTPEAQSKKLYDSGQARISFEMPEDGTVYLLNQMMTTLGDERTYTVPIPDQTKLYAYEFRVEFVRGGKKYYKKSKLSDFRAGSIVVVKVEAPPVPDGEPAEIAVESEFLAAGGVGSDPPEPMPDGTSDDAPVSTSYSYES